MSLGSDFSGVEDLTWDLVWLEGEGPERLAYLQAIGMALLSERGSVEYAPSWGLGLDKRMSTASTGSALAADIVATALDDERTANATATVAADDPENVRIALTLFVTDGATYELTVSVDRITAAVEITTGQVVIVRREATSEGG